MRGKEFIEISDFANNASVYAIEIHITRIRKQSVENITAYNPSAICFRSYQ